MQFAKRNRTNALLTSRASPQGRTVIVEYVKKHQVCLVGVFAMVGSACTPVDSPKENISDTSNTEITTISTQTIAAPNAPSRITRDFWKGNDGNLLIAALDDIVQYDGHSFIPINKPEGVESFSAFDVLQDQNGNIWIASRSLGVFRYDGKTFSHFTVANGLADNTTISVYEDKAGRIWAATQGGLSFYAGEPSTDGQAHFQSFTTENGLTSNEVNVVMEDSTGRLWIGTRGKLAIYDASASHGVNPFTEVVDSFGSPLTNVWSIIEDQSGSIWLAEKRGLWRFRNNVFSHVDINAEAARLYEDRNGNIWFTHNSGGTQGNGLSYFDHASLLSVNPKATLVHTSKDMLFGLSEDKDGNIWVGSTNGVTRINPKLDGIVITTFIHDADST